MPRRLELPEQQIIELYSDGYSLRELAKIFATDKGVIKNRLLKNKIQLRTLSEANRIYNFNELSFEKIDTHEKAYWLGFIGADGSINKNSLKIDLSYIDFAHLEKFRGFLGSNHPIHTYYPKIKDKVYKSCEISVRSDKLIQDLFNLNVFPNKSKVLIPAPIKKKFNGSYILGLIDGDGCISIDKNNQIHMSLTNSLSICEFVMDTLVINCDITPTKIIAEKRSPGTYYCYFGGNNKIKSITDYLYADSPTVLDRKRKIIQDHFEIDI